MNELILVLFAILACGIAVVIVNEATPEPQNVKIINSQNITTEGCKNIDVYHSYNSTIINCRDTTFYGLRNTTTICE